MHLIGRGDHTQFFESLLVRLRADDDPGRVGLGVQHACPEETHHDLVHLAALDPVVLAQATLLDEARLPEQASFMPSYDFFFPALLSM